MIRIGNVICASGAAVAALLPLNASANQLIEGFTFDSGTTAVSTTETDLTSSSIQQFNMPGTTLNSITITFGDSDFGSGEFSWTSTASSPSLTVGLEFPPSASSISEMFTVPGTVTGAEDTASATLFSPFSSQILNAYVGTGTFDLTLALTGTDGDSVTIPADENFGGEVTYDYTVPRETSVPEPLTLSLFGAGLIGAAAMRRRKAKQ